MRGTHILAMKYVRLCVCYRGGGLKDSRCVSVCVWTGSANPDKDLTLKANGLSRLHSSVVHELSTLSVKYQVMEGFAEIN